METDRPTFHRDEFANRQDAGRRLAEALRRYQDQQPHYAPKRALTLHAWRETKAQDHGRPRQVLRETLYRLAPAYGLVNRDGAPLKHAIEECVRVANWRPEGGAPKKESCKVAWLIGNQHALERHTDWDWLLAGIGAWG